MLITYKSYKNNKKTRKKKDANTVEMIATPHKAREQKDLANNILDRVKKLNPGNEEAWTDFAKSALLLEGKLKSLEQVEAATGISPACERLEKFLSAHKIAPAISCSEMHELAVQSDYTTTIVELYQELMKLNVRVPYASSGDSMKERVSAALLGAKKVMAAVSASQCISRNSPTEAGAFGLSRLNPLDMTVKDLPIALQEALTALTNMSDSAAPQPH